MGSHFNILVNRIVCLFKTKSKKKYIYKYVKAILCLTLLLFFVSVLA